MSRKQLTAVFSLVRRLQDYHMTFQIHPHFQNQDYNNQSHLQSQALTSQEHYTFVKLEFKAKFAFVSSPAPQQEQSISKSLQIYQCRPSSLHNRVQSKVCICLFTCAATRAVHLEVVTDLSVQTFLLA